MTTIQYNDYGRIIGILESGISEQNCNMLETELDLSFFEFNKNYRVIEGLLMYSPIGNAPIGMAKPIFDEETWKWIETAVFEEVQENKRIELKMARDTEIFSHYLHTNGYLYDADLDSRNRLFQAQQLGVGTETNINWITADNQVSSVSNTDLINIANGIAYREQLAFNKFASKYTEVLNCTNIDDVKSIKY